ncbi:MAG: pyridoxal-phosphate dependent enzyme [Pseudomonadota bacterium]
MRPVSAENIKLAASIVDKAYLNSPLLYETSLDGVLGAELFFKVESLNPIRSFKARGVDFFLSELAEPQTLVCATAGNFGQAMARAGRQRGHKVVIYAAENANPLKIDAMRRFGGDVRLEGADFDAAKAAARRFAKDEGALFVEDGALPAIAEGAGAIALEITEAGANIDAALVPLGNGALATGVGTWLRHASPDTEIVAIVAGGAPAMKLSFEQKQLVTTPGVDTIADGVAVREPVPFALQSMESSVDHVVAVDEDAILKAMRLIHEHLGLVIEPAGAIGVAALLSAPQRWRGKRVATVLCGGNLTPAQIKEWL